MTLDGLSNRAAWLTSAKSHPFDIAPAPIVPPGPSQVLIRAHAVAINPIDYKLQATAFIPLQYPAILGQDVAGEVVAVGAEVNRFKLGDRVLGVTAGSATRKNEERAFQEYVILEEGLTAPVPEGMAYERAVVVPLGATTGAAGLFLEGALGLSLPTERRGEYKEQDGDSGKKEVVLVLGGASSVGISAVQLAVAAGYEVVATSSPRKSETVLQLGATKVFDYHSHGVVDGLLEFTKGKAVVGVLDAVGAQAQAIEFVQKAGGRKLVATTIPFEEPPEGVSVKFIQALSIKGTEVGKVIWETYLPQALSDGRYVPAPEPVVVGKGLESIQKAVDLKARGGTQSDGKKIVVILE
ncbi:hypothetical protein DL546_000447 [Coniochaeta pulveracea]|uniref:Enoyl reductase (ER) domain-containing protein n=1 Tax=Coniochaeta pulveracea TaxID=177199 RepID=A0A420XW40_9PEZI|nr:hypothetical protein DL546_000447 [Coniochaeta pulveracea]